MPTAARHHLPRLGSDHRWYSATPASTSAATVAPPPTAPPPRRPPAHGGRRSTTRRCSTTPAPWSLTDIVEDDFAPQVGDTVAAIIAERRRRSHHRHRCRGAAGRHRRDRGRRHQRQLAVQRRQSGWTAFAAPLPTPAVLLDAAPVIRFVPNADYNGPAGDIDLPRLGYDRQQPERHHGGGRLHQRRQTRLTAPPPRPRR